MTWELAGRPLRAVLVSRLRYLGDVAMATVVPELLARGDPRLEIGFLCEAHYAAVLANQPRLVRVHGLDVKRRGADARARAAQAGLAPAAGASPGGVPDGAEILPARPALALLRELRGHRYDLAVDLFFNPRSAILLRLAGCRWRIAGARSWRRRLYTHTAEAPASGAGLRQLVGGGLADHLGRLAPLRHRESGRPFLDWCVESCRRERPRPRLAVPPLLGPAGRLLAGLGLAGGDYTLLVPGATWVTKEWPVERWRELVPLLVAAGLPRPLVLTAPEAPDRYGTLNSVLPRGEGVLPALPLPEALRLVGSARLVICVDGGIMHAAVGMGRPTLALFGPTDPAIWFPYEGLGPYRVLCTRPACHPCHRHDCGAFICLPDLSGRQVAMAAVELLAGRSGECA
jgi:ADP-heptose:LPS heptosyltransferase